MTDFTTTLAHRTGRSFSFSHALMLWRTRAHLRDLTQGQLEDVGLTRAEAEQESNRPFWDAPDAWKIR